MRTLIAVGLTICLSTYAGAQDWPQWRGPTNDNHAAPGATAPVEWSETAGLAWLTPLPGRGHSSPVLAGERIYLTTAEDETQTQSLLVLDRQSGKLLTQTPVHRGGFAAEIHPNNSQATPTVVVGKGKVYALFDNNHTAQLSAFDLEGKLLWTEKVAEFNPQEFKFGFGSSPRIEGDVIIVSSEYDGADSGIIGVNAETGKQVWKAPRPESLSYSTPIVLGPAGKRQLVLTGNRKIAAYNPKTGDELWALAGSARATCGTMVDDPASGLAFGSGGYPESFTLAVRLTGEPGIAWQNQAKCYEQSMLVVDGYLYAATDSGVAFCWRCADGEEQWKERLSSKCSSSPVLVDDKIYITTERGETVVFAADPTKCEVLARNQLGDSCFATSTPVNNRLYHRFGRTENGVRQEYLAAIGE